MTCRTFVYKVAVRVIFGLMLILFLILMSRMLRGHASVDSLAYPVPPAPVSYWSYVVRQDIIVIPPPGFTPTPAPLP